MDFFNGSVSFFFGGSSSLSSSLLWSWVIGEVVPETMGVSVNGRLLNSGSDELDKLLASS